MSNQANHAPQVPTADAASPVDPTHTANGFEIMYENEDGWCDWIHPIPGYRMSCCGCGLIHDMEFQIAPSNRDGRGFNPGESDEIGQIIFRARQVLDATPEEMEPPSPLAAIRFRMEQGGHSQADFARLIGSRSRAAEILNGKRSLSKTHIRLLVDKWGIPARSLLGPRRASDTQSPPSDPESVVGNDHE